LNDELERWIDVEGPPPEDVGRLLDAACGIYRMTPEQQARLDARVFAAVAEDRRRRARQRAAKRALGAALVAACVAGAIVVALRLAERFDPARPDPILPRAATEEQGAQAPGEAARAWMTMGTGPASAPVPPAPPVPKAPPH
jgi:hypothetical protein